MSTPQLLFNNPDIATILSAVMRVIKQGRPVKLELRSQGFAFSGNHCVSPLVAALMIIIFMDMKPDVLEAFLNSTADKDMNVNGAQLTLEYVMAEAEEVPNKYMGVALSCEGGGDLGNLLKMYLSKMDDVKTCYELLTDSIATFGSLYDPITEDIPNEEYKLDINNLLNNNINN